tara:strand:- start:530 stop:802 length:273 start_codon:yes stop_codon:yes gene_type:complete
LVPLITSWQPPGASLLAAILVLTLMILSTIALTSTSALASVPRELLAGSMAYAMGDHRASLFASGLLLTVLVWLLSWFAHRVGKGARQYG